MTDGVVQVAPDSTGKRIDTSELTRSDATVVERQRVVIGDDTDASALADLTNLAPPTNGLYALGTWVLAQPQDIAMRHVYEGDWLAAAEQNFNTNLRRHGERGLVMDRRGGLGRGSTR